MTLPSTGAIKFSDIATVFGLTYNTPPRSLNNDFRFPAGSYTPDTPVIPTTPESLINIDTFHSKTRSGCPQWTAISGGTGNNRGLGVVVDSGGNVYTTGCYSGIGAFYTTAGTYTISQSIGGGQDIFLAKYNSVGIIQWVVRAGSAAASVFEQGNGISIDSLDNIYIAGSYSGAATFYSTDATTKTLSTVGSSDIFVAKYSSAGVAQWAVRAGSTSTDGAVSIKTDSSGITYVTGYYTNACNFYALNGTTLVLTLSPIAASGTDIFLAKYDTNGNIQWAVRAGSATTTVSEQGMGVDMDSTGNVYMTGFYNGACTFYSTNATTFPLATIGAGFSDIFIAKYNSAGVVQWATRAGSSTGNDRGNGIAVDSQSNVYVTGYYTDTCTFYSTDATTKTLSPIGVTDIFLTKYNSSGVVEWAVKAGTTEVGGGDTNSTEQGISVVIDGTAIYITGTFYGYISSWYCNFYALDGTTILKSVSAIGGNNTFLARYNNSGIVQWVTNSGVGGNIDENNVLTFRNAVTIRSSNIYITGEYALAGDVYIFRSTDGITEQYLSMASLPEKGTGVFLARYDTSGIAQWATRTIGSGSDRATGITTDSVGNIYVTGYYNGTCTFFSTDLSTRISVDISTTASFGSTTCVFLAKYDSTGIIQWVVRAGTTTTSTSSAQGAGVAVDINNNVYITGYYGNGTITFYGTDATTKALVSPFSTACFLAKYNSAGVVQWAVRAFVTNNAAQGTGVDVDSTGNYVYITGYYALTVNFYGTDATTVQLTNLGSVSDIFLAKYNSAGVVQWAVKAGTNTTDQGLGVAVDSSDNILITGTYTGTVTCTFYSTDATIKTIPLSATGTDSYLAQYSPTGVVQWAVKISSSATEISRAVTTDLNGNSYITGYFGTTTINFYATDGTTILKSLTRPNGTGVTAIFVAKYSSLGACQWAVKAGGTTPSAAQGTSIAADAYSNVFMLGYYGPTALNVFAVDGTTILKTVPSIGGTSDVVLTRYNSSTGTLQWAVNCGTVSGTDQGWGVATGPSGAVYITGYYGGDDCKFYNKTDTNLPISPLCVARDMFITKYIT